MSEVLEKVKVLAINPGSTSTKVAVMELDPSVQDEIKGITTIFSKNIKHSAETIKSFERIADQYSFRKQAILSELESNNININDIQYIIGRGGLVKSIPSGIYEVNEAMIHDLTIGYAGEHACNLGGIGRAHV